MDPYAGYGYRDAAHMADPDEAANALETDLAIEHDEELLFNVRQSPLTPIAQLWPIALGLFGWVALNAVSEAVVGSPIPWITQVGVLVGQQDGRDLLRRDASLPQTPQQRAQRKARVEQHSSRAGLRDERVPAAAAAQ